MLKKIAALMVLAIITISAYPHSAAQESEEQPLLQLLALVPDNELGRSGLIIFADMQAYAEAYGTLKPESAAEFAAMLDAESPESDETLYRQFVWWRTMRNFSPPSNLMEGYLASDGHSALGFEFPQVDYALTFASPAEEALILSGDFDEPAIREALSAENYSPQERSDGVEVWCAVNNCFNGHVMEDERPYDNPFGGRFGRRQPLVIRDNLLYSSPEMGIVNSQISTMLGQQDNLASHPDYQSAVEAITQDGVLVEAVFVDRYALSQTNQLSSLFAPSGGDSNKRREIYEQVMAHYETLPVFEVYMMADIVTETEQVLKFAFVYVDPVDAQTAVDVLIRRFENLRFGRQTTQSTVLEMMAEVNATMQPPALYNGVEGRTVVVFSFTTPRPQTLAEIVDSTKVSLNPSSITAPGLLYQHFFELLANSNVA